ncbi:RNA helicase [Angomonas deanei]|nr:RNA helicase [Angomonas deanei]|eukprot:EPY24825.1 RNA helicase [Angomonas deanei]
MTAETKDALETTMGFKSLLKSQAQCYKGIFVGRDVILHSRTGSGKTLAYALPIIERHLIKEMAKGDGEREGPFLLVFVFSNDLAVQTKHVLSKIYPKLHMAVAGLDPLTPAEGVLDVLIGTAPAIDIAIRGKKSAAAATALEEKEKAKEAQVFKKRPREEEKGKKGGKKKKTEENEEEADEEDAELNESSDDETMSVSAEKGEVSAANVSAIVVDEVDTTLGPRFTNLGRRVKNLLKYIRRANGSLTDGLLTDYRAHHYVLCGATIPNWVLKAGFLGVKKYYYRLVNAGSVKLPDGLEVYRTNCVNNERVPTAAELIKKDRDFFGRCVVFGSPKQVEALEALLVEKKKTASKKKDATEEISVRSLTADKKDSERFAAVEDFNENKANILLCTDVAARGIDMLLVDTVFMLSLPAGNMASETFVHRAGRTARVGHTGKCVVLVDPNEKSEMDSITRTTHVVFKVYVPPSSAPSKGKGSSASVPKVRLQLTVRNPFKYSKPDMVVPTAAEVLEKQLGEEYSLVEVETPKAGSTTEEVCFAVPAASLHIVKEKLWKYKVTELK